MLGQPIADITECIGVTRQIDTVAQRRGGFCACRDDRQVQNGERKHGLKLVRDVRRTKGLIAQIRRASAAPAWPRATQTVGQTAINLLESQLPTPIFLNLIGPTLSS